MSSIIQAYQQESIKDSQSDEASYWRLSHMGVVVGAITPNDNGTFDAWGFQKDIHDKPTDLDTHRTRHNAAQAVWRHAWNVLGLPQ